MSMSKAVSEYSVSARAFCFQKGGTRARPVECAVAVGLVTGRQLRSHTLSNLEQDHGL